MLQQWLDEWGKSLEKAVGNQRNLKQHFTTLLMQASMEYLTWMILSQPIKIVKRKMGCYEWSPRKLKSTRSIKCNKTTGSFAILANIHFTNKMHTLARQRYTQDESTNIINLLHKKSAYNTCYNRLFIRIPLPISC